MEKMTTQELILWLEELRYLLHEKTAKAPVDEDVMNELLGQIYDIDEELEVRKHYEAHPEQCRNCFTKKYCPQHSN